MRRVRASTPSTCGTVEDAFASRNDNSVQVGHRTYNLRSQFAVPSKWYPDTLNLSASGLATATVPHRTHVNRCDQPSPPPTLMISAAHPVPFGDAPRGPLPGPSRNAPHQPDPGWGETPRWLATSGRPR